MSDEIDISLLSEPTQEDMQKVFSGLGAYNEPIAGKWDLERLVIHAKNEKGEIVGGVVGETFWKWLKVSGLWVNESQRGKGLGSKLMAQAESEALKRGCQNVLLQTFSFQARPFYEKLGYQLVATIEGLPPGHSEHTMTKKL